jgi:acetyl esterase/lipase
LPVVVLIHGGFWRAAYDRSLMTPLAVDLAKHGYAAWNVEYRRVGHDGGGWPGTLADVAAGVDYLVDIADAEALDVGQVVSVGHSAGGHLALWLAARPGLPMAAAGSSPRVALTAAVAQAGVVDLREGYAAGLGRGACVDFLGGSPDEVPERYELASPAARLPLAVRQLLVHGDADDTVPVEHSRKYAVAATAAGDRVELVELEGADHFDVIDPNHAAWHAVIDRLPGLLASPP